MKNKLNAPWILIVAFFSVSLLMACAGMESKDFAATEVPGNLRSPNNPNNRNQSAETEEAQDDKGKDPELTTWKRSGEIPNTARLFVGDTEELELKGQQISVKVEGFRARVVMDYYFHNDGNQQLEGTFKLKLPNDAVPHYLAFGETELINTDRKEIPYVNYTEMESIELDPEHLQADRVLKGSQLREAKVVPKNKGSFAYTQTVSKKVDPALMEWAGADLFNCRVFPILPQKSHHIVVAYDVNLTRIGEDLVLEMDFPQATSDLAVNLALEQKEGLTIASDHVIQPDIREGFARVRFFNPEMPSMKIRYKSPGNILMVDETEKAPHFAASFLPDLPVAIKESVNTDAILILDRSLSSQPDQFNIWLKLAEALLTENPTEIQRFAVLTFNIDTHWWKPEFVANTPENRVQFLKYADSIVLEGASDVGQALETASHPEWLAKGQAKNLFLLSDGAITWGKDEATQILTNLHPADPVFAFSTGLSGSDTPFLSRITRQTGGNLIPVLGEGQIGQAAQAFRQIPWKVETVKWANTEDVLFAGGSEYVFPGTQSLITGRGTPRPGTPFKMKLSRGQEEKWVSVKMGQTSQSALTHRVYGQVATQQIEEMGYLLEPYAEAFGVHYRVPGATCSLVMLEDEGQYGQFDLGNELMVKCEKMVAVASANQLIDSVKNEYAKRLTSEKYAFQSWVEKMESQPGVELQSSTFLTDLLDSIPEESFHFTSQPLKTQQVFKSKQSGEYRGALEQFPLVYQDLTAAATLRKDKEGAGSALICLSSLIERSPGDAVLARDIGYSAMEWGLSNQAYHLFLRTAKARPWEPISYQALAQVAIDAGQPDLAMVYFEIALAGNWNSQFGDFKRVTVLEYMRLLRQIERKEVEVAAPELALSRLRVLEKEHGLQQYDIAVVITWNTANTDIDLHVTDPKGVTCNYLKPKTKHGGKLHWDATQGYGPEMFTMNSGMKGDYTAQAKYYSSNNNRAGTVGTKVYATVYRDLGRPTESAERVAVRLEEKKSMQDLMEFEWTKSAKSLVME